MNNSQVIIFLKTLTSRELKKLEQLLESNYFNNSRHCLPLYRLIKEEVLNNGRELTKQQVFMTLFGDKNRSIRSISGVMSRLLALAEEVLIQEQLRLRPHTRNYLLMKALGEKGDGKLIEKIGNRSLKKLETTKKLSREDYSNRYRISNLLYELEVTTSRNGEQKPEMVVKALDAFYLCHRLPLTYEMLGLQGLMTVDYHDVMTDKLLELSERISFEQSHLIELYRQSIVLFQEMEVETHFETFLVSLDRFAEFTPSDELHSLYAIAQNYCIKQIIKGKRAFYDHLFLIYTKMIAQNVLFTSKYIPAGLIKNIVTLSCQIGKYAWAHRFLKEYKVYLEPKVRQVTYKYFQATIFFYEKDFGRARELLVQTQGMEVFFEVGRKFFLLKIYYELGQNIALQQLLISFNAFIRSNKVLSTQMKTPYLNFTKALKSLAKIKQNKNAKKLDALKEKLEGFEQLSDKRWLLEKIEQL